MTDRNATPTSTEQALETSREAQLLIPETPLQVLPTLAVAIGLNQALFLQQLHSWIRVSPHVHQGRRWVPNGYEDWQDQFPFWSQVTIRRLIKHLEQPLPGCDRPMIASTSEFNSHCMTQTKWYSIDYAALNDLCPHLEGRGIDLDPAPGLPPDST